MRLKNLKKASRQKNQFVLFFRLEEPIYEAGINKKYTKFTEMLNLSTNMKIDILLRKNVSSNNSFINRLRQIGIVYPKSCVDQTSSNLTT